MTTLDPVVLAAVRDLELVARVTVDGALAGLHPSPFHGYSAEFNQYRHYRPGDDLKYVDWKLFARTDRVYTKQFRETTNVRMQLVLDASASMAHRVRGGASKLEYARLIAAGLADLVVRQGDAAGLTVHDAEIRSYFGARGGRTHLRALLTALSQTAARGRTASAPALRRSVDMLKTRSVVILISDLYDDEEGVGAELRRASRIGHDITVFHVLTRDELHLPGGAVEYEDAETGQTVLVGRAAATDYESGMTAFLQRWRDRCASYGIDYCRASTDVPLDTLLRTYLLQRLRHRRR